jgi:hypothetical protein
MHCVLLAVVVASVLFVPAIGLAQETGESQKGTLSVEARLCTGIEDRMPVGVGEAFDADVHRVYFWTRVTGAADSTSVRHIWLHEDSEIAVVELPVRSTSWRTWSHKTILPEWTGKWEVRVVDADDDVLKALSFTVGAPTSPQPADTIPAADTAK